MASKIYAHNYRLAKNGSTFTVINTGTSSDYGPATVSDDGTTGVGDNPNILGDVQNDQFSNSAVVQSGRPSTYVGSDTNSSDSSGSFVATYTNNFGVTSYFLYTDTLRANNSAVAFNRATATPICYAAGTRILTTTGQVVVEDLRVGDLVVTSSGAQRPIRWIGHRTMDPGRHPRPEVAMPVRIAAEAFGENRPMRDLVVSPGHAICFDVLGEVLIPASALVNGTTITQEDVDSVTYFHVELDGHDILVAEGQPAESYLDMGNRLFFADGVVVALGATPDGDAAARTHADFCRPFVDGGVVLDAVQAQIRARAERLGWRLDDAPWADAHLMVDGVRIDADMQGLAARFVLPADAEDVWLVSQTSAPREIGLGADPRRLGLRLQTLTIDDGVSEKRTVALDDPLLSLGFHDYEEGLWRWTAGRSRLPAALFDGCRGTVFLRLELAGEALPRWAAPHDAAFARPSGRPLLHVAAEAA